MQYSHVKLPKEGWIARLRHSVVDEYSLSPVLMWRVYCGAALVFLPTLFIQYIGEEAVTVIVTQEMWATRDFVVTTLYGQNYGRPGLYSWIMLPVAWILGWSNILIAARLITIAATILTGLTLAWLVRRIFKNNLIAAFAAAVYLSGDVLIYRGSLAYVDPLFSLLAFIAMSCLWVATAERRYGFLILGAFALIGTFLAKTLTGYAFYGLFALVLLWRHENRAFIFRPISLAVHAAAIAFPFSSDLIANHGIVYSSIEQIVYHLSEPNGLVPGRYIAHLLWYPFRTTWYLLPGSAIAIYSLARRTFSIRDLLQKPIDIAVCAVLINVMPYWLAPDGGTRYLMPLYPLFALVFAFIVLHSGRIIADVTVKALLLTIAVAYVAVLAGFPLYEHFMRGSYADAARTILAQVGEQPIYAEDNSSVGVSIVANLNVLRAPKPPISAPPAGWTSGFLLAIDPDQKIGRVGEPINIGHRIRYLLCRGPACELPFRASTNTRFPM
jgi:4-amino-4-deoxy-L-arabinose transferase-like glycosyltransferase